LKQRLTVNAATPCALRVARRRVDSHRCFAGIVDSGSAVLCGAAVGTASSVAGLLGSACEIFWVYLAQQALVERELLALRAELDHGLLVIALRHPAAMAFELAFNHDHHLAIERVFDQSVLCRYGLPGNTLHELSTKDHHISTVLNEDAVAEDKVLVPQEQIVFIAVFDGTDHALVLPLHALDHLVETQRVALRVSAPKCAAAERRWQLLAEVCDFDIFNLTLLVDEFDVVLVDLQNKTCILVAIVLHQIHR